MDYQTLYISYVGQQREDLQSIDELPRLFLSALDFEGEDGGNTVGEILLVELVVVMTREGRMVHFVQLRIFGDEI